MKTMLHFLYMVTANKLSIRANPTANDLLIKQRLLNNQYSYRIPMILIECSLSMFRRTLLDSIVSYYQSILLITMIYFRIVQCSNWLIRFVRSDNPQMDEMTVVYFMLNMRPLFILLLSFLILAGLLMIINFIYFKL